MNTFDAALLTEKYEGFGSRLEELITGGELTTYMQERLSIDPDAVSVKKTNPPLSFMSHSIVADFDVEQPQWLFQYFAGQEYPIGICSGRTYATEIYAAARDLLGRVASNPAFSQNVPFVKGLSWLLEGDQDGATREVALDVLLAREKAGLNRKNAKYDRWLLRVFAFTRGHAADGFDVDVFGGFPPGRKDEAQALFLNYINQCPDLADLAGAALLNVDYDEGIRALPLVIDQMPTPAYFMLDWYLHNRVEPAKLAQDVVNAMGEKHIDYFMRNLQLHSGGFKDEKSLAFKTAVEKLTGRVYQQSQITE